MLHRPLDKILEQGTSYTSHERAAYIIKKIGTDATSATYLKIDNKVTGNIIQYVAPLHKTNSTIIGPLNISDMYYVIPNDTDFSVEGASGAKVRIIGEVILLNPGESLPGDIMARYEAQFDKHRTYVTGSYTFNTDEAWADGTEVTLLSLTPKTIETYVFDSIIMIDYSNATINPGDVAIQFYIDNNPVENLFSDNMEKGIDMLSMPFYDDVSANEEPFTLRDYPIEVKGDHTLKITATNVSGGSITPPSGTAISLSVYAVVKFLRGD